MRYCHRLLLPNPQFAASVIDLKSLWHDGPSTAAMCSCGSARFDALEEPAHGGAIGRLLELGGGGLASGDELLPQPV
jgi:hypothetical protein